MHLLKSLALGLFVSLARALPTNTPPVTRFNLIHQHNNLNSRVSTTAWTNDWSRVLGHSCSASLLSGTFEHLPVHFNVDQAGRGSVLLGATSHFLQGSNKSEHVECSGMYGEAEYAIKCTVTMTSLLTALPSPLSTTSDCQSEGPLGLARLVYRLSAFGHRRQESLRSESAVLPRSSPPHHRRQGACGVWSDYTVLFEDGHPHQHPLHKQITANLDCADGTCSAEHLESESFTVSFTASASAYGWIDGGFAVEKSVETGLANSCNGGFNERVCV